VRPLVAILGRPNVGKSTLFNRIAGRRLALVRDVPGVTRDRHYADADWQGRPLAIVDTGGFVTDEGAGLAAQVRAQAELAAAEADVVLMVVDGRTGPTAADETLARALRRTGKPLLLVVNKLDSPAAAETGTGDFYRLGIPDVFPVSAEHALGFDALLDTVVARLPAPTEPAERPEPEENAPVRLTILGRPNVGKSRLLNAILGQERVIVSDEPGTTRDAIDTRFEYTEGEGEDAVNYDLTLIDTAGIRKRGRIDQGIERYSVIRTLKAIQRADVVLMVIDATEGITAQDTHIAGYVLDEVKGMVLVVNKWDLVEKDSNTIYEYTAHLRQELSFIPYVTFVFISAKFGQRVTKVLPVALSVARERMKRVSTGQLNKLMKEAVDAHPPASKPGKWVKFYYATQADVKPPTFVFFTNDADSVHFSYKRYLENQLRGAFGFEGTPIKLIFRTRQHTD